MSNDGVINGTKLTLYLNSEITILSTNLSWNVEHKLRDTSCREGNSWASSMGGDREWGVDCDMMVAFRNDSGVLYNTIPGQAGVLEIISKFIMRQKKVSVMISLKNQPQYTPAWAGSAYITSVSIDAPNEANSTFSMSISGTGEMKKRIFGPGI